jgi:hypothetical protein
MDTFTWIKGESDTAVITWQSGGVALSVTIAQPETTVGDDIYFFSVGIVGVIDGEEIILSQRSFHAIGKPNSGCYSSCMDLLTGPSLDALKNVVFVIADRSI